MSTGEAEFRSGRIEAFTLQAGMDYLLEIHSVGGEFTVTGTRDGSGSYRFSSGASVIGHAQFRSAPDAAWEGWPIRTTTVDTQFDISFYVARVH